jgi:hypothetical protein
LSARATDNVATTTPASLHKWRSLTAGPAQGDWNRLPQSSEFASHTVGPLLCCLGRGRKGELGLRYPAFACEHHRFHVRRDTRLKAVEAATCGGMINSSDSDEGSVWGHAPLAPYTSAVLAESDQHWRSRQTGVVAHASESVLCTRGHAIMLLFASHSRCTCNRHHHTTLPRGHLMTRFLVQCVSMQALTSRPFCSLQLASLERALGRAQCIRASGEPRCRKAALPSSCTVASSRSRASMSRTGRRGGWCS